MNPYAVLRLTVVLDWMRNMYYGTCTMVDLLNFVISVSSVSLLCIMATSSLDFLLQILGEGMRTILVSTIWLLDRCDFFFFFGY